MLTGKPEMLEMFRKWSFSKNAVIINGTVTLLAPVQKTLSDIQSSVASDYQKIECSIIRTDIGRWSEEYIYEYFKSNPTVFTSVPIAGASVTLVSKVI